MKHRRPLFLILLSLCGAGCYDFVEPDFPEAGGPALLQASAYADENGSLQINALLAPGLDANGVERTVPNDTLDIYGLKLAPKDVSNNGSRTYSFFGEKSGFSITAPFDVNGPRIDDVVGPPPRVHWFAIKRTDPDTVVWTRGTDLVLHVDTAVGVSLPPPAIRQWFLTLSGASPSFRVSSDGLPPTTLRIPVEWVPTPANGFIVVTLSYFQGGQQQGPSRDYIGNITFNITLRWIIRAT